MDPQDLLAQAEAVVSAAKSAGAQQAEAYIETSAGLDLDIEADAISGSAADQSRGGAVRVIHKGRLGFAYFTEPDQYGRAIEQAMDLSVQAPDSGYRLPTGGAVAPLAGRWDDALAALDPAMAVETARDMIAAAKDECPDASVSGGGVSISASAYGLASSEGVEAHDRWTDFSAGVSLTRAEGSSAVSTWDSESVHVGVVDGAGLGGEVARRVVSLAGPKPASSGPADLVFLPDAAADVIRSGVMPALDGDSAMRGRSVWAKRLGEEVTAPGLSLIDDPQRHGALGSTASDGEGLATRRQPLIEAGHLRTFLFDSWSAHKHGQEGTHHASRDGFKTPPGTGAHHLVLEHDATLSLDRLLADVEHGFLVESVLGAHTANAVTGDFSVTAPNVWRIEDGQRVGASKEIAIGGNVPALLSALDAVSDEPRERPGSSFPAVRIRDVAVSA